MDPYLAKLIGRDKTVAVCENSVVVDEAAIVKDARNVLAWHPNDRPERPAREVHCDVTRSKLRKENGLVPHTTKYTLGTRTFILIKSGLTGIQRDLLTTDMLVIEYTLRESLRRGDRR